MDELENRLPLETRVYLIQRDVEMLKMRDAEIKAFQEKMNAAFYKLDMFERSIEDHKERLDEVKDVFQEAKREIFKKIDDSFSREPAHSGSVADKSDLINTIAKIIFALITIIGTALLGAKFTGVQ